VVNARNELSFGLPAPAEAAPVAWRIAESPLAYESAVAEMAARAAAIADGRATELVWLLEHPPLYTAGTSARSNELIEPRFPVHQTGRGGQTTYHGPGQRVAYVMLDLEQRGKDIRRFVQSLEQWMIDSLAELGVSAHRAEGRIGIWVGDGPSEAKIGALGVRIKRWVTLHGIALNVAPDLAHFSGIVPCGIGDYGVTSLAELGKQIPLETVDCALRRSFLPFLNSLEQPCKVS
jgi:lipoyl(octanoyl) transferase